MYMYLSILRTGPGGPFGADFCLYFSGADSLCHIIHFTYLPMSDASLRR